MSKTAKLSDLPYRQGVGLMLLNRQGLVFTARRIDTADAWQMPQGGIDAGETPAQAAIRELQEEIGTDKAEIVGKSAAWLTYDLPPNSSAGYGADDFAARRRNGSPSNSPAAIATSTSAPNIPSSASGGGRASINWSNSSCRSSVTSIARSSPNSPRSPMSWR